MKLREVKNLPKVIGLVTNEIRATPPYSAPLPQTLFRVKHLQCPNSFSVKSREKPSWKLWEGGGWEEHKACLLSWRAHYFPPMCSPFHLPTTTLFWNIQELLAAWKLLEASREKNWYKSKQINSISNGMEFHLKWDPVLGNYVPHEAYSSPSTASQQYLSAHGILNYSTLSIKTVWNDKVKWLRVWG